MKPLSDYIRTIPDFPEQGVLFRDITTLIKNPVGLHQAVNEIMDRLNDVDYDIVVGPESRGFIFGVPVAYAGNKGFVPARKKGKLPCDAVTVEYDLEYGKAVLEIHKDAIRPGQKVAIVDDLLATGGTTHAVIQLIEELGGDVVKICFVIELEELRGREFLADYKVESLLVY